MKKKKFSEITKVSGIEPDERVLSLSSDMKTMMAAAKNALTNSLTIGSTTGFTGNNAHEIYDRGLTLLIISNGVSLYGFPYDTGFLLNINRGTKGVVTSSQIVYQIYFGVSAVYYRYGLGSGTTVNYQPWKRFVFEAI